MSRDPWFARKKAGKLSRRFRFRRIILDGTPPVASIALIQGKTSTSREWINERRKQHNESSRRDIIKSFKLIYACDDELIAFYLQRVRCESIMQGWCMII